MFYAKTFAKLFCKCFSMLNIVLKIDGWLQICKNVLEPREVDGSKTFLQMFYFTRNHFKPCSILLKMILA